MSCDRFADALNAHALGAEIPEDARVHLTDCRACQASLDAGRRVLHTIDSDLRSVLSVEPSPDFVRRMRARIVSEPKPRRFPMLWWVPATAVAVAVLAVLIVNGIRRDSETPQASVAPSSEIIDQTAPVDVSPDRVMARDTSAVSHPPQRLSPNAARSNPRLAQRSRLTREPEVLVEPGQKEALLRFVRAMREGRIDGSSLVASAESIDPASGKPRNLSVEPIKIDPLIIPLMEVGPSIEKNHGLVE